MNRKIIDVRKKIYIIMAILTIIFVIVDIVFLLLLNKDDFSSMDIMGKMCSGYFMYYLIIISLVVATILVPTLFYIFKIRKYDKLVNVKPISGVIVDFIVNAYNTSDNVKYYINPVILSDVDGKKYFTYGDYSVSWFTTTHIKNVKSLIAISIIRSNGSVVNIGDRVNVYINRLLDNNVSIKDEKLAYINNKKFSFRKYSEGQDINVLNDLVFFEGAVDVDLEEVK